MKRYKVLLTKVASTHNNLRTDETEGITTELPEKGKFFILAAKPLVQGAVLRMITTTEIQNVEVLGDEYMFQTLNSTYKVKVLEEILEGAV